MDKAKEISAYINKSLNLKTDPCDYFTGVRKGNDGEYINLIITTRVSESREFVEIEKLCKISKTIRKVEPNGVNRVAVYLRVEI